MRTLVGPIVLLMSAAACSSGSSSASGGFGTSPTAPSQVASEAGNVNVTRVRVFMKDGIPQAYVEGDLGDGCTRLLPIVQQRSGHVVQLTVSSVREGEVCTMIMQFVNEWVPLTGLDTPGAYSVRANRSSVEFSLVAAGDGALQVSPDPGPVPVVPSTSVPGHVAPDAPPAGAPCESADSCTSPGDPGQVDPVDAGEGRHL